MLRSLVMSRDLTLHRACYYLSMPGLKLIHDNALGSWNQYLTGIVRPLWGKHEMFWTYLSITIAAVSLTTENSQGALFWRCLTWVRSWINTCIHNLITYAITHPCTKFNGSLTKQPFRVGLRWVITPYCFKIQLNDAFMIFDIRYDILYSWCGIVCYYISYEKTSDTVCLVTPYIICTILFEDNCLN